MMEGISGEAASLAGHLKLSNLCWIYDNNHITIEGQHRAGLQRRRGHALHRLRLERARASATPTIWRCSTRAFDTFQNTTDRPTLIIVDSHIAYGAPNKQDTSAAHGEPLGEEEIRLTKRNYGWPEDAQVPGARTACTSISGGDRRSAARQLREAWMAKFDEYKQQVSRSWPITCSRCSSAQLPDGWDKRHPAFPGGRQGHGRPRRVRQGAERHGPERSVADRRRGRSGAFHQDAADVRGRRRLRGGQLRRPQSPLRHPRTRHGVDPERHVAVQAAALRIGLPDLQRLYARAASGSAPSWSCRSSTSSRTIPSASAKMARRISRWSN